MPITHNIKSPVTLAAADITEAEIANGAVTDNKVNFTSSIAVGNSTVNTTITNQSIDTYAPITNKNLIINGAMNVYQRTANSGSTTANGYNLADRWETTGTSHGSQTHGITTDIPTGYGFSNSYRIYRDGINDSSAPNPSTANILTLSQKIEGQNLQHLCKGTSNAKELTLSFWSKFTGNGASGSVYVVELVDLDNTRQISKALTSSSDWTKNTVTFPADTTGTLDNDNNASLQVNIWLNAGSNYTSGTFNDSAWASTTDANRVKSDIMHFMSVDTSTGAPTSFHFTGVQLEIGDTATSFEFENPNTTTSKLSQYGPWVTKTNSDSPYTAVNNDRIFADTSGGAVTVTLPASPNVGDRIKIVDLKRNLSTNNLTVGRNGNNIASLAEDLTLKVNGSVLELVFSGETDGWVQIDSGDSVFGRAIGGTITSTTVGSNVYNIHTFTESGVFTVPAGVTLNDVEYLVIAGGGAGKGTGGLDSGGGGAGGYRCSVVGETSGGGASAESRITMQSGDYTITVGGGGATSTGGGRAAAGQNSSISGPFQSITSTGGGGGGDGTTTGGAGGSGGGGGGDGTTNTRAGGTGTSGQGFNGGGGRDDGGGGGGAAAAGTTSSGSGPAGVGGNGRESSITGSAVTRAGGGGGGGEEPQSGGTGGGGAGNGGASTGNGGVNTGGGGGGGEQSAIGGNGGSGIVVIRYII